MSNDDDDDDDSPALARSPADSPDLERGPCEGVVARGVGEFRIFDQS